MEQKDNSTAIQEQTNLILPDTSIAHWLDECDRLVFEIFTFGQNYQIY